MLHPECKVPWRSECQRYICSCTCAACRPQYTAPVPVERRLSAWLVRPLAPTRAEALLWALALVLGLMFTRFLLTR